MLRFKNKPNIIEAIQFIGNFDEVERFVGGDAEFRDGKLVVATLNGPLFVELNDWIIKGMNEFYSCKPHIFDSRYELLDD